MAMPRHRTPANTTSAALIPSKWGVCDRGHSNLLPIKVIHGCIAQGASQCCDVHPRLLTNADTAPRGH